MRDSALKLLGGREARHSPQGRRRAHARQRFETFSASMASQRVSIVGEELMRDSALKPLALSTQHACAALASEKSSCATAL